MIPKVRDLRVTDIRCRVCSAPPGEDCVTVKHRGDGSTVLNHSERVDEHLELAAAGWEWQEVDPTDAGARKE